MAANNVVKTPAPKLSVPPLAIVIGVVLVLGLAGFYFLERASNAPPPPLAPLTGEAREYVKSRNLRLANVEMKAHESYLRQAVTEPMC